MKYQFRVRAVNKGGQSKPSEPSDPITAKDRFGESDVSYLLALFTHLLLTNLCSKVVLSKIYRYFFSEYNLSNLEL
jgi:hypothetical protein